MITTLPSGIAPLVGQQATGAKSARNDFNEWLRSEPNAEGPGTDPSQAGSPVCAVQLSDLQLPSACEGVFALHVRDASGSEELLSVPWGLAADGRLSVLLRHATTVPVGPSGEFAPVQGKSPLEARADRRDQLPASLATIGSAGYGLATVGQAVVNRVAAGSDADSMPTVDSGGAPASAYAAPWLSRLVRWVEQGQLPPTVWIRDFALDENAKQRLADLVRELADEHGVRLHRIVVNSHEIWSAARGASKEND